MTMTMNSINTLIYRIKMSPWQDATLSSRRLFLVSVLSVLLSAPNGCLCALTIFRWGRAKLPDPNLICAYSPSTLLLTSTFTDTRRFCALPSSVSLLTNGSDSAIPVGVNMRYGFHRQACCK